MRFFNPVQLTTNPGQVPRERLDPGPPPGSYAQNAFDPHAHALLGTLATNEPAEISDVLPRCPPPRVLTRETRSL